MKFFCLILLCIVLVFAQKNNKADKTTPKDDSNAAKLQCGKNEVQNDCPKYGFSDPDCNSLMSGFKKNCPPAPADYKCVPRCDCKKDFVRVGTECVSPDRCCTGKNEEITDCPADCDNTCDKNPPLPGCKLIPCFNKGCKCKKNYVRYNSTCIERKDCPDKVESTPNLVKKLEACNAKKKQATADAVKKAGKAKIVTSKNFVKRSDVTPKVNATQLAMDLPKAPVDPGELPLKPWLRLSGILGRTIPTKPSGDQTPSPPSPTQSTPSQPAPSQPAPSQPAPSQPAPSQPAPSQPAPSQPAPTQPAKPKINLLKPVKA